jgi:hypothetical protein
MTIVGALSIGSVVTQKVLAAKLLVGRERAEAQAAASQAPGAEG